MIEDNNKKQIFSVTDSTSGKKAELAVRIGILVLFLGLFIASIFFKIDKKIVDSAKKKFIQVTSSVESIGENNIGQTPAEKSVLLSHQGFAAINNGNEAQALKFLQQSIAADPNNFKPYHFIGYIYYGQKKYNEAIKYYEKSLTLNPNYPESQLNLVQSYFMVRDYKKVAELASRYLTANPGHKYDHEISKSWLRSLKLLGRNEEALAVTNRMLEHSANESDKCPIYKEIGDIYLVNQENTKELPYFFKALDCINNNLDLTLEKNINLKSSVLRSLAAEFFSKDNVKAKKYFQELVNLDPKEYDRTPDFYKSIGVVPNKQ